MPQTIESDAEFIARHCGGELPIRSGRQQLLPDGALMVWSELHGWQHHEPPTDASELLRAKRAYHATATGKVEQDFDRLKAAISGATDGTGMAVTFRWPEDGRYGPAPEDGVAALRHLKTIVEQRRAALAEIASEIADLPESRRQRERAEQAEADAYRRREAAASEQAKIQSIEI